MEVELSPGGSVIKINFFAALKRGYVSNGFSQLDYRGVKESWLTEGRFDRRVSQLQCNAVQCSAVQLSAIQYCAMQCGAMHYCAMQCGAMQCSAVKYKRKRRQYDTAHRFPHSQ